VSSGPERAKSFYEGETRDAVCRQRQSKQKGGGMIADESRARWRAQSAPLILLFFLSGFPALIYQIVWQRALFSIYGINIESVTNVVTVFLLGLGLGSLLGGALAQRAGEWLIPMFCAAELGISVYGFYSLRLFRWLAETTAGAPLLEAGVYSFLLVLLPTILMGSTLPLLVTYFVRGSGNVGQSVGQLYFVNTVGSAVACFCAAMFLLRDLGQSGAVATAAMLNAAIAIAALLYSFWTRRPLDPSGVATGSPPVTADTVTSLLPFPASLLLALLTGFIALGYEIVWYRLFHFATAGHAKAFALLLFAFLSGIALGSLVSERLCRGRSAPGRKFLMYIGAFTLVANLVGYLVAPYLAATSSGGIQKALPLVALASGMLGAVFPLVSHVSIAPDRRVGARLSYLYLANILGSAAGSFVVGFILMDVWGVRQISSFLAVLGVLVGTVLWLTAWPGPRRRSLAAMAGILLIAGILLGSPRLYRQLYERLLLTSLHSPGGPSFRYTIENKSGVINVTEDGAVFGGGIYDGRFSVDLIQDVNGIVRPFALSSVHPKPRHVLMIGLAGGAWAQVIAHHPQLESLTIVEINPGYLQLIPKYPEVASLLRNPKVEIVIDDGRRWLARNRERRFDAVVMNSVYYWRAHSTDLLSMEFLSLVRRHLHPGGIAIYNTLGGRDVFYTGLTAFPHGVRIMNFLVVSDAPIVLDKERWRRILLEYRIDGQPVLDLTREADRQALEQSLALLDHADPEHPFKVQNAIEPTHRYLSVLRGRKVYTDDNMGGEWE
jgi:spermidine synthase